MEEKTYLDKENQIPEKIDFSDELLSIIKNSTSQKKLKEQLS